MRKISEQELQDRMDEIQKECHAFVNEIKSRNKRASYSDATNVFLFMKLASLELQIERILGRKTTLTTK